MRKLLWLIVGMHLFGLQANVLLAKQLSNIRINPAVGRKLVEDLRSRSRMDNTTSNRREMKNVIFMQLLDKSLDNLSKPTVADSEGSIPLKTIYPGITFVNRDAPPASGRYVTYTIYSHGLVFPNEGISTKIKLRGRFYLTTSHETSIFQRSKNFENTAFLEIKIKNPSADEENLVYKYRIKVLDQHLVRLYKLDANKDDYKSKLLELRKDVKAYVAQTDHYLVDMIFDAIKVLSKEAPAFTRPGFAISYERQALKYVDKSEGSQLPIAENKAEEEIEYQITVDKHVRGYKIPDSLFKEGFSFTRYFLKNAERDRLVAYPDNARATEIKIPGQVGVDKTQQPTGAQIKIHRDFVGPVFKSSNTVPGFVVNKGKAGHFKKLLKRAHINLLDEVA